MLTNWFGSCKQTDAIHFKRHVDNPLPYMLTNWFGFCKQNESINFKRHVDNSLTIYANDLK